MPKSDRTVRILKAGEHYAARDQLVIQQRWDDIETTMAVRRVIPTGHPEELQLEISIKKFGEKRTTQMHSSFCIPAQMADKLVEACGKMWEPQR